MVMKLKILMTKNSYGGHTKVDKIRHINDNLSDFFVPMNLLKSGCQVYVFLESNFENVFL